MSSKRKSIGLPAQARPVPPVPNDYGIGGSPSPVVTHPKKTNQRDTNTIGSDPNCIQFLPISRCPQLLVSTAYPGKPVSIPREPDPAAYLNLSVSLLDDHPLHSFTTAFTSTYSADENSLSVKLPSDCPFPNHVPPPLERNPAVSCSGGGNESFFLTTITHSESHPTGCLNGSGDHPWPSPIIQDSPASSYPPMVT
jgi:hypothetical protein